MCSFPEVCDWISDFRNKARQMCSSRQSKCTLRRTQCYECYSVRNIDMFERRVSVAHLNARIRQHEVFLHKMVTVREEVRNSCRDLAEKHGGHNVGPDSTHFHHNWAKAM